MTKSYGFDPGASRDVGILCIHEASKTLSNGSCPGWHNAVIQVDSGAWSIDDTKMGNTYISHEQANTLAARDYKQPQAVIYPQKVGTIMANSHPGSYCGQDAYNDMFIVESWKEK